MLRLWTKEEKSLLKEMWHSSPMDTVYDRFPKRTRHAVRRQASRLGLTRSRNWAAKAKRNRLLKFAKKKEWNSDNDIRFCTFIAGFVAGEGSFVVYRCPGGRKKFVFQISLADDDAHILRDIQSFLGVGNLCFYKRNNKKWKGAVQYAVTKQSHLIEVIIPLFDKTGFFSTRKQKQYDSWRKEILEYMT